MYTRAPEAGPVAGDRSGVGRLALGLSVAGVILLGVFPGILLGWLPADWVSAAAGLVIR